MMRKPSMLNIKGIIILVAILTVLDLVVAWGVSPLMTDPIVTVINKNVDPKVLIEKVSFHPLLLSFTAKNVELFDPKNPSKRMFFGQSMSGRLSPIAFLSKRIYLSSLSFKDIEFEVVKSSDGSLNIENIAPKDETQDSGYWAKFKGLISRGKKDWFGQIFERIKQATKSDNKGEAKSAIKTEKKVVDLPKGKAVTFESPFNTVFKIGKLKLRGGKLILSDEKTKLPAFEKINLTLKNLKILRSGQTTFTSLDASGRLKSEREGSFDIALKFRGKRADVSANIRDIDMGIIQPIYKDSCPVTFKKGFLTLSSKSRIEADFLDSKNKLGLKDFEMSASSPYSVKGVATKAIAEALNQLPKLELKFRITGTPKKPSFEGFRETILDIAKEHMEPGLSSKASQGIKDFFSKEE